MAAQTQSDLPLDIGSTEATDPNPPRRHWFKRQYLLVLLVPILMFSGAVVGMYFQPPLLRAFYSVTGLQPGGGSATPISGASGKTAAMNSSSRCRRSCSPGGPSTRPA